MTKLTKDWATAALIRAARSFAQVALGGITVGAALDEVNWLRIFSVAAVAAIYSILTSIVTGLPEARTDGTLIVDDTNEDTTNYLFQVETPLDEMQTKKSVRMNVEVHK